MTETEVKIALDDVGYAKFLEYFESSVETVQHQWNIFFDNENHDLRNANRVLRLRSIKEGDEPTKWVITIKKPGSFKNGVAIRPEKEYQIPAEIAQDIIAHPVDIMKKLPKRAKKNLKDFQSLEFTIIGDFITERRIVSYDGLMIEADETTLPNKQVLYELEIENNDPVMVKQKIDQKLKDIRISYKLSKISKLGVLLKLPIGLRCSREFSKI